MNQLTVTAKDEAYLSRFLKSNTGIELRRGNSDFIISRLANRVLGYNFTSLTGYLNFALRDRDEAVKVVNLMTTNKTSFYRESKQFDYLTSYLEEHFEDNRYWSDPLNFWSAGCSTGQEAYTLAIVLTELKEKINRLRFKIRASDINSEVIQVAKRGIYSASELKKVETNIKKSYFLRSINERSNLIRVAPEIRRLVDFRSESILKPDRTMRNSLHCIFCRNVTIYFSEEVKKNLFSLFADALVENGLLMTGHSEKVTQNKQLKKLAPNIYQKVS